MVTKAFDYINENKARFLKELGQFLEFASISTQCKHKNDLVQCALWLKDHLSNIGLDARLIETDGHPIIWARGKGQSSRRLIIYGHYDVQPADPVEKWDCPAFVPTICGDYIYARGATDDKGQLFAHIKGVESLMKTYGKLPCEVMFLIEGEEESGGISLRKYIRDEKSNLAADAIVISDTAMYDENTPAITYGLRGVLALEVVVKGPTRDLHSGIFGGAIGNPAVALARIISECIGPDGKVGIDGFYDKIRPLEEWEKQNMQKLQGGDDKLLSETGSRATFGERGFSTLERVWARPSFDINGMFSGYTDKGMKTIIPSSATAKISIRLVPDQNPDDISGRVATYIKSRCPDFVNVEVKGPFAAADPVLFDVNDPMLKAACQALKNGFGAEPVYIRCGGSIPAVNTFWQELKKPIILMGFGLDSDGAHSPNERFKIANFINGAKSSVYLMGTVEKVGDAGG